MSLVVEVPAGSGAAIPQPMNNYFNAPQRKYNSCVLYEGLFLIFSRLNRKPMQMEVPEVRRRLIPFSLASLSCFTGPLV